MDVEIVEETWKELGFKLRANAYYLIVRTKPHIRKTASGLLWLPPKLQDFHGELPHLVETHAVVLSAGPRGCAAEFQPGETVAFKRLYFGYWYKVGRREDQEFVGWVDANQVLWKIEDDEPAGRAEADAAE